MKTSAFFSVILVALFLTPSISHAKQDLGNFSLVAPGIYRGARPSAEGLKMLKALGVKTIINLEGGDSSPLVPRMIVELWEPGERASARKLEGQNAQALGMGYLNIPLNSVGDVTPEEEQGIDTILRLMANPAAQPVFVHCEHGKDRTGLVIALYEVEVLHKNVAAAYAEMISHGHGPINMIVNHDMDEYFLHRTTGL